MITTIAIPTSHRFILRGSYNGSEPLRPRLVWYLAYGSNMSSAKFTGSRGIVPQAIARVRVPGHILAFNIPGLPYSEPTFTSIVRSNPADIEKPELLGVAYLITQDQYIRVLASEGGGIAYDDIEVKCIPVSETDRQIIGSHVMVKTLGPAMERSPWPKPSRRYMVGHWFLTE